MNRRGFLTALAGAFGAAAADPDRLLWTPGRVHYSIPKPLPPLEEWKLESGIRIIMRYQRELNGLLSARMDVMYGMFPEPERAMVIHDAPPELVRAAKTGRLSVAPELTARIMA